jgi:hypothetical protein
MNQNELSFLTKSISIDCHSLYFERSSTSIRLPSSELSLDLECVLLVFRRITVLSSKAIPLSHFASFHFTQLTESFNTYLSSSCLCALFFAHLIVSIKCGVS